MHYGLAELEAYFTREKQGGEVNSVSVFQNPRAISLAAKAAD